MIIALSLSNPKYPPLLKEIPDPPKTLYVRGKRGIKPIDLEKIIAVVGTRKITEGGKEITRKIVKDLVSAGYTIVSGMALGVDTVAHQTALDNGGATIAVLGCGVDVIAPASNTNLYWDIVNSGRGAILSEMPLGLRPDKKRFVTRNRIISGLVRGIVVTEGFEKSGTLITANYAADQGRDVFVTSWAPKYLVDQGATLVETANDILSEYAIDYR